MEQPEATATNSAADIKDDTPQNPPSEDIAGETEEVPKLNAASATAQVFKFVKDATGVKMPDFELPPLKVV
ncbi:hypothetical protein HDU79_004042 [Rhizoclosmatium sp. JEL0117]|nr:hypothetical protein HDU79_004042 [Rhizoclosmatium sp. JEL0117]